ncbi:MAG TPA: TrbI/VirB10 family protein [Sphingomicrobium sp.]|jgi:type IV secretion system protein VirB10|nr:TrbI/VirB10 family protein [Sphingomicrobium sp.]
MNVADRTITPRPSDILGPQPLHGALVAFDPRRDMDEGALVAASRMAYPAVAAQAGGKDKYGLLAGGGIALMLGAVTFWGMSGSRDVQRTVAVPPTPAAQSMAPAPALPPPTPEQLNALASGSGATPQGSLVFRSTPQTYPQMSGPGQVPSGTSVADRLRSPTLLFDSSGPVLTGASPATPATEAAASAARPAGTKDEFAAKADASASDTATATRMTDPANTVSQGTLIPAVLETAINSDLPGYARAVVSQDIRSFDGSKVLIPRSSRLIGQYRSGLAAGQTRAYVLWSRLIRPDGVSVAIASPGTDEAGTTGLTGDVQSHFFKRFGSAMLLSVVGAASAIGTGGASLLVSGGSNAAGVAAQQNGAIPPTVRVRQGQPVRVFTARDLNFSQVTTAAPQ